MLMEVAMVDEEEGLSVSVVDGGGTMEVGWLALWLSLGGAAVCGPVSFLLSWYRLLMRTVSARWSLWPVCRGLPPGGTKGTSGVCWIGLLSSGHNPHKSSINTHAVTTSVLLLFPILSYRRHPLREYLNLVGDY